MKLPVYASVNVTADGDWIGGRGLLYCVLCNCVCVRMELVFIFILCVIFIKGIVQPFELGGETRLI
jgi:hypothetical protein